MLLPRELDFFAASEIPLPVPKPKIATLEARKQDDKKHDDKGKANSADAGTVGIGRQTSSPAPKVVTSEAGKQDSKRRAHSAHAGVTAIGRQTPAPEPTPKIAALEVGKHDGKGKANAVHAGSIAARGDQKTLLAPKSRTQGIELKKHGEGKVEAANGGDDKRAV